MRYSSPAIYCGVELNWTSSINNDILYYLVAGKRGGASRQTNSWMSRLRGGAVCMIYPAVDRSPDKDGAAMPLQ